MGVEAGGVLEGVAGAEGGPLVSKEGSEVTGGVEEPFSRFPLSSMLEAKGGLGTRCFSRTKIGALDSAIWPNMAVFCSFNWVIWGLLLPGEPI